MSDEYKPNKMEQEFLTSVKSISISLKEIKEQITIKNKIDSTKLVLELANNKTIVAQKNVANVVCIKLSPFSYKKILCLLFLCVK